MSSTIDQRIVEMKFDNNGFEKNVSSTLDAIDRLDESINMLADTLDANGGAFSDVQDSIASVGESVKNLENRFGALGTVAYKWLEKMAEKAFDASAALVKSFTTDQIGAGMTKYERKMTAVQTIALATKKSFDEVEVVMDRLTAYSDQTSYKFDEMANFIGQFTSAGITDLDMAEQAIEGIANASAKAGINADTAGRAMSAFAKAMSSGKMSLQQWTTLELMNFATEDFKEQLIQAGLESGTLTKGKDGKVYTKGSGKKKKEVTTASLRDTLSQGWLDQQTMMKALGRYYYDFENPELDEAGNEVNQFGKQAFEAGQKAANLTDALNAIRDASSTGWMRSWQYIFGGVEEAEDLFTGLADTLIEDVNALDEFRNKILSIWADTDADGLKWYENGTKKSGREYVISAFQNAYTALEEVSGPLWEAWKEVFYPINHTYGDRTVSDDQMAKYYGDMMNNASKALEKGSEKLLYWLNGGDYGAKRVLDGQTFFSEFMDGTTLYHDVAATIATPIDAIKNAFKGFLAMGREIGGIVKSAILPIFSGLGYILRPEGKLIQGINTLGLDFQQLAQWIKDSGIAEGVSSIVGAISEFAGGIIDDAIGLISRFIHTLMSSPMVAGFLKTLGKALKTIGKDLKGVLNGVKRFVSAFLRFFTKLAVVQDIFNVLKGAWDSVVAWAAPITNKVKNWLKNLWDKIKTFFGKDDAGFDKMFEGLGTKLDSAWTNLKDWFTTTFGPLAEKVKEVWNTIKQKVEPIWEKIKSWFAPVFNWARTLFGNDGVHNTDAAYLKTGDPWFIKAIKDVEGWFNQAYSFLTSTAKKAWDKVAGWFNNIRNWVSGLFSKDEGADSEFGMHSPGQAVGKKTPWFVETIQSVKDWFDQVYSYLTDAAQKAWDTVSGWFTHIWSEITGLFTRSETSKDKGSDKGEPWFVTFIQGVKGWFDQVYSYLTDAAQKAWDAISGWFTDIWGKITGLFSRSETSKGEGSDKGEPWFVTFIQGVKGWFDQVYSYLTDAAQKAWDAISGWFTDIWGKIAGLFTRSETSKGEGSDKGEPWFVTFIQGVKGWFDQVYSYLTDAAQKAWDTVSGWFTHIWSEITGLFTRSETSKGEGSDKGEPWFMAVIKSIEDWFGKAHSFLTSTAQTAWNKVIGWFNNVWNWVGSLFSKNQDDGSEFSPTSKGQIKDQNQEPWFVTTIKSVSNWFSNAYTFITSKAQSVWTSISDWFSARFADVRKLFSKDDSEGGAEGEAEDPWYIRLLRRIGGFFEEIWSSIQGPVGAAWSGITSFFDNTVASWFASSDGEDGEKSGFSKLWDSIQGACSRFADGVIQFWNNHPGLQEAWENVKGFFAEVFNTIASLFGGNTASAEGAIGGAAGELAAETEGLSEMETAANNAEEAKEPTLRLTTILTDIGNKLSEAYTNLSGMSTTEALALMTSIIGVISGLLVKMAAYNLTAAVAGLNSAGRELFRVGLAIAAISASIFLLSLLDKSQIDNAFARVREILWLLIGFVSADGGIAILTERFGGGASQAGKIMNSLKSFGAMFVSIGLGLLLVSIAIGKLASLNPKDLQEGGTMAGIITGVMTAVVLGMTAATHLLPADGAASMKAFAASFLAMSLSMIFIATALQMLEGKTLDDLAEGGTALMGVEFVIGVIIAAYNIAVSKLAGGGIKQGAFIGFAIAFGAMSLSLIAIAKGIEMLSEIPEDQLDASAGWATKLETAIGAILIVASKAGQNAGASLKGVGILALVMVALLAFFMVAEKIAAGGLDDLSDSLFSLSTQMETADEAVADVNFDNLKRMAETLKSMTWEFMQAGLLASAIDLDTLSTVLFKIKNRVAGYQGLELNADENGHTIVYYIAQDIFNAANEFASPEAVSKMDSLVRVMSELSGAMELYRLSASSIISETGELVSGVSPEAISKVFEDIAEGLESSNVMESISGAIGEDVDQEQLVNFATAMGSLAAGLRAFSTGISGINEADVSTAESLLTFLSSFGKITSIGDVINSMLGTGDMSKFGEKMEDLAAGLEQYATAVSGMGSGSMLADVAASVILVGSLSKIEQGMKAIHGIKQWFSGEQDISDFGAHLAVLGKGVKEYSDSIKDLDSAKFGDVSKALDTLVTIENNITKKSGGLEQWFTGEGTLKTFGQNLATLGSNIAEFNSAFTGFTGGDQDSRLKFLESMVELETRVTPTSLGTLGAVAADAGNALENFDILSQTYSDIFGSEWGEETKEKYSLEAFKGWIEELKTLIYTVPTEMQTQIITYFDAATSTTLSSVKTSVSTIIAGSIEHIRGFKNGFKIAGMYLIQGLESGIRENGYLASNAAYSVGANAVKQLRLGMGVESPSWKAYEAAGFLIEGGVNGLHDKGSLLEAEAMDVGTNTADALRTVMASLSASLAEDMDPNPTIRPVLDLSDVENGTAYMRGLFTDPRYGFSAYNSASMAARVSADGGPSYVRTTAQSPDMSEIADRLDSLAESMTHLQVVLETGVLVGQLTPAIDRELGRSYMRSGRGG